MANQFGIDLGQVYSTGEAVKGARLSNKINNFNYDSVVEDRATTKAMTATRNALKARIASGGTDGQQAQRELIAMSPDEGKKVVEAFKTMSDQEKEQAKQNIETIGKISAYILQGDPKTAADRYQTAKANLSPEVVANMPAEYDPNWVQMNLAKSREMDDLFKNPEVMTFGTQDKMYKDGVEIGSTQSGAAALQDTKNQNALAVAKTKANGTGLKSADESLMYRQSAEMLGGIFDQNGNIQNLDPQTRSKVQAIATRASELYSTGQAKTRTDAVTMAARQIGISVQNLGGTRDNLDPMALVQQYSQ